MLLGTAGVFTRRWWLLGAAGLSLAMALGVSALQRRFLRRWAEVDAARKELRSEVTAMSETLAPKPANSRDS